MEYARQSRMQTFLRCPYLWYVEYVLNIAKPPTPAILMGLAIHETLGRYGAYYIHTRQHSPLHLDAIWEQVCSDTTIMPYPLELEYYNEALSILKRTFGSSIFDLSFAIAVEDDFDVQFGGMRWLGRIDRIDRLARNCYRIVDYKSGRMLNNNSVLDDFQLSLYALAFFNDPRWKPTNELRLGLYNVRYDIYQEETITEFDVIDKIAYYKNVYDRMCQYDINNPAPTLQGNACLAYGGCWAAGICPSHQHNVIGGIDLTSASGAELLNALTTINILQTKIKKTIRGMLESGENVESGSSKALLVPRSKTTPNPDMVDALCNVCGILEIPIDEAMSFNSRKKESLESKLRNAVYSNAELSSSEQDELMSSIDTILKNITITELSGTSLKIGKADDLSEDEDEE